MNPNWDQIYSGVRQVLLGLGAGLVMKGYLTADQLNEGAGLVIGGLSSALSFIFHSDKGQSLMPPRELPTKQP